MANRDVNRSDYALDRAKHNEVFEREIVPEYYDGTEAADRPKAIIIAGQPGSGKGRLTEMACKEFGSRPEEGHVEIDVDNLREHHPEYGKLRKSNDRTAAGFVQEDAGDWADELKDKAIEGRRNLIIDGTLKSPDKARDLCEQLKSQGYEVEVRVMAVHADVSIQGIYGRYEKSKDKYDENGKKKEGGPTPGRWVPEAVHDDAYNGVVDSIRELDQAKIADKISVYGRDPRGEDSDGKELPPKLLSTTEYSSRSNGDQIKPDDTIVAERNRRRTPQEQEAYDREWNKICDQIDRRDPDLSEPENKRAHELARGRQMDPNADRKSSESGRSTEGHDGKTQRSDRSVDRADANTTGMALNTEHRQEVPSEWGKQAEKEKTTDRWSDEPDRGEPDVTRDSRTVR